MKTPTHLIPTRNAAIFCGIGYFSFVAALFACHHPWIGALVYAVGFALSSSVAHPMKDSPPDFKMAPIYMFCSVIAIMDIFMVAITEYEQECKSRFFAAMFAQTLVWCKYLPGLIILFLTYMRVFAPPDWRSP